MRNPSLFRLLGKPQWLALVWISSLLTGFFLSQWGTAAGNPVDAREGQKLLYQFRKAQAEERRRLQFQQRTQMKEMRSTQDQRFKEWNQRENAARREYFATHKGAEKREYMQDLKKRRQEFEKTLKEERAQRSRDDEARRKTMEEEQGKRLERFREFLSREETPPKDLWPQIIGI